MGNFSEDLKIGEYVQDFLIEELAGEFGKLKASEGEFSDYDLISEDGYTFEVKFDRSSRSTKNTAIEFRYKGRESGICSTKAIEWIQVLYNEDKWVYCRIPVENLRNFLRNNWEFFKTIMGGDDKQSALILVNKDIFLNEFEFKEIKEKASQQ